MRGLRRGGKSREEKGNNSLKSRSYSCCILVVYRCLTMVQRRELSRGGEEREPRQKGIEGSNESETGKGASQPVLYLVQSEALTSE